MRCKLSFAKFYKQYKNVSLHPQIEEVFQIKYGFIMGGIDSAMYFILMAASIIASSDCLVNNSEIQKMLYRFATDSDYVIVDTGENK